MAYIPESVIQEIIDKADIETVVGKYVDFTKRTGNNLFGCCPFHSEKTPSFSVSPQRGIYKCFGCQKGGNVINFIMDLERVSFPEAAKILAKQFSITIPEENAYEAKKRDESNQKKQRILNLLTEAARFYYSNLISEEGKIAQQYAISRGLSVNTVKSFGLGYAPSNWGALGYHLKNKGYTEEEMSLSGLFSNKRTKRGDLIELFRGRLMFPIFDVFGNIIAFGGRALGDEMPKYINSPDSYVYHKQNHLYALNFAKKERAKQLIIVEGYMDVIAMHQAGIKNVVASLGTAFTDSQLRLAAKYCEEIIFFFDADNAGQNAAIRAIKMMLGYLRQLTGLKISIKIAKVPDAKDPDEYIREFGKDAFASIVKNALPVDEYLLSRAYDDNYDDKLDLDRYQNQIVEYGSWFVDTIKRERMASVASIYLKSRIETILALMDDAEVKFKEAESRQNQRASTRHIEEEVKNRQLVASDVQSNMQYDNAQEPDYDYPNEDSIEPSDGDMNNNETSKPIEQVDDFVSQLEMELFCYAMALGSNLADEEIIQKIDVIRPSDFTSSSMRSIVECFLKLFEKGKGVNEALFIGKLRDYTLNGSLAEGVYLFTDEKLSLTKGLATNAAGYLVRLYKLRKDKLLIERQKLIDMMGQTDDDELLMKYSKMLDKINEGVAYIRSKELGL